MSFETKTAEKLEDVLRFSHVHCFKFDRIMKRMIGKLIGTVASSNLYRS